MPTAETASVRGLISSAARRLAEAGVGSPEYDAAELAAHVLGVSRGQLGLVDGLDERQRAAYDALVEQRADRVPLQHLTGVAGFRYLTLAVGPGVFVPRPETELLVDAVLGSVSDVDSPVVVDLCSGSGAIALSLAHERPDARVFAAEVDPVALAWSRRNADRREAAGDRPVSFVESDARDPGLFQTLDGRADAVVTNPPYVPDGAVVAPEAALHDPAPALWGGPDGLDVVRGILVTAARLLRPGGFLAVEHADAQGESMPAAIRRHGGWTDVEDHPDLTGRPRYATARRV